MFVCLLLLLFYFFVVVFFFFFFFFFFVLFFSEIPVLNANSIVTDQTQSSVASDVGSHC